MERRSRSVGGVASARLGKRFGIGLLKGLLIGAAIGCGVTFGAHWSTPNNQTLAYLLAFGAGGTTGIFGGRAPWKEGAWLEAAIKCGIGLVAGGALYWVGATYGAGRIPWPGASSPVPWTSIPPLYLAAIGAIYGALVELDHDDGDEKKPATKKSSSSKVRVAIEDDETEAAVAPAAATRAVRKK